MPTAVDYRQRVDEELDEMSPSELEKVYRAILFLKEEFFDAGEGRYYTDSWACTLTIPLAVARFDYREALGEADRMLAHNNVEVLHDNWQELALN